jgi:hypothetical protein
MHEVLQSTEVTTHARLPCAQDLEALQSQAGFPPDPHDMFAQISKQQWDEFLLSFRAVLELLQKINPLWNQEDPCIIAGFDMDRRRCATDVGQDPEMEGRTKAYRLSNSSARCFVLSRHVATKQGCDPT